MMNDPDTDPAERADARDRLIRGNLPIVPFVLNRMTLYSVDDDDKFGWGWLGLVVAVDKFDPAEGYQFSTYARKAIWRFVMQAVREHERPIRIPSYLLVPPGEHEPASRKPFREAAAASLALKGTSDSIVLKNLAQREADDREADTREQVERILGSLSARDADLLRRHFGVGGDRQTLTEIAADMGRSQSRASQLFHKAFRLARKEAMPDAPEYWTPPLPRRPVRRTAPSLVTRLARNHKQCLRRLAGATNPRRAERQRRLAAMYEAELARLQTEDAA
jgi:RNA polymerase sigma factor (sigma-70 family)